LRLIAIRFKRIATIKAIMRHFKAHMTCDNSLLTFLQVFAGNLGNIAVGFNHLIKLPVANRAALIAATKTECH